MDGEALPLGVPDHPPERVPYEVVEMRLGRAYAEISDLRVELEAARAELRRAADTNAKLLDDYLMAAQVADSYRAEAAALRMRLPRGQKGGKVA